MSKFRHKFYGRLVQWKVTTHHECLLVKGARPVMWATAVVLAFACGAFASPVERSFRASCDGSEQKYIVIEPETQKPFAGVLVALAGWLPEDLPMGEITKWGLYVLLVCVGFGLGMDEGFFASLKTLPLRSLLLPLVTIVGSLAGGLLAWWIVSLMHTTAPGLADTLAVTSGFGYYSLSSVLLDEARGPMIATIALASNLLRELLTLLTAPLLRRWFGPYAVIASGGATSMDTTLPVAVRYGGSRYAPVSIYHGFFLTVAVPFIVSFFISYA